MIWDRFLPLVSRDSREKSISQQYAHEPAHWRSRRVASRRIVGSTSNNELELYNAEKILGILVF